MWKPPLLHCMTSAPRWPKWLGRTGWPGRGIQMYGCCCAAAFGWLLLWGKQPRTVYVQTTMHGGFPAAAMARRYCPAHTKLLHVQISAESQHIDSIHRLWLCSSFPVATMWAKQLLLLLALCAAATRTGHALDALERADGVTAPQSARK